MNNGSWRRIPRVVQLDQSSQGLYHRRAMRMQARTGAGPGGCGQGGGLNPFPPTAGIPEYAARNLPPLPLRSSASPVYDSEESSSPRRPASGRLLRLDSPGATHTHRADRGSGRTFGGGALDEQPPAIILRPPSIITDLYPQSEYHIYSPRPRNLDYKLLHLRYHEDLEVSPIMTPQSGNLFNENYTVSPLTPEHAPRGPFVDEAGASPASKSSLHLWQDAARDSEGPDERRPSRIYAPIFAPITTPLPEGLTHIGDPRPQASQNTNRYSDSGNTPPPPPPDSGKYVLPLKPSLKHSSIPRVDAEHILDGSGQLSKDPADSPLPAIHGLRRSKSDGSNDSSAASGRNTPKVSFALDNQPQGFSTRPRASSTRVRGKPKPLQLVAVGEGAGQGPIQQPADEHVKTPYPETTPVTSGWDSDAEEEGGAQGQGQGQDQGQQKRDEAKMNNKRLSWGRPGKAGSGNVVDGSMKAVGKLYSRAKEAGEDVITKVHNKRESYRASKIITQSPLGPQTA